jgi:uncharacterized protein
MNPLTVRKLQVDLAAGFDRHWHGGDAFRTAYYNALSMSFPVGEQYFIDAVRAGAAQLAPGPEHDELRTAVQGFIGQEATHRHLHGQYNAQLEKQGLVNHWQRWAAWRIRHSRGMHTLHHLAVTAAYEHCTAVFADGTLRYPEWFAPAQPKMRTLWIWHAAEETEHRAVAFELYQRLGGGWLRRSAWFVYVLGMFSVEAGLQSTINLWRDGTLFKFSTLRGMASFYFGRDRMLARCMGPLLAYLKPGFHPDQERHSPTGTDLAQQWLQANAGAWRAVR